MITKLLLVLVGLFVVWFILFLNFSPHFGAKHKTLNADRIQSSPNYHNGKFKNLEKTSMSTDFNLWSLIEWFKKEGKFPNKDLPVITHDKDYLRSNTENKTRITWFGHSTSLVEIDGKIFFLDPVLGDSGPRPFKLRRFTKELPVEIEDIERIDAVILSHDHYDHLDYPSIMKLKDKAEMFYVPLGVGSHLVSWGIDKEKIVELDWWENARVDNVTLTSTPARHFSGRGFFDNKATLWTSWVIEGTESKIFFSGDSGYAQSFKKIGEMFGPFDLVMLDSGQYSGEWANVHMNPEEAVQASIDLQAKVYMPIHWNGFVLSYHGWSEPVERASAFAKEKNVTITTPQIGEPIIIGEKLPDSNWWK